MAHVYRAHQENLDREVAVKILPPWYATDRNFVERFHREARLVARLSHPNIVTIHDFSEGQGHLYIVMQLVDGGTLKHRLDEAQNSAGTGELGALDIGEVNRIFQQLASALTYAHENGIIHRDIKPVNVLMERSGRPILSDFGIAKVLAGNSGLTRPGAGVGTPEYMSPEQCRGEEEVDGRADIYALGVMLFESLTGRTPFVGENYHALAHSHLYQPPPDPRIYNPRLSPQVCKVILTALQKQPAMRYQSASDLALALEQAAHPSSSIGDLSAQPTQKPGGIERVPTSPIYACPNCQRPNRPDTYFCVRCGTLLNQCPKCRSQNRAKDRFCTRCGQALVYRFQ
jgi:serine/threonine-protein kinase